MEGDWPDAYRVNRFVKGIGADRDANEALSDFQRFPTWMWRNTEVAAFVEWLRDFNEHGGQPRAVFYGLDLYGLYTSIDAVIKYLEQVDPDLARSARARYSCFDHLEREPHLYGYAVNRAGLDACEDQVVQQFAEVQRLAASTRSEAGPDLDDDAFFAEQNAHLVKNAERYYRAMYRSNVLSWNVRDRHMAETLDALLLRHQRLIPNPRAVVWAHNSHVGDARATEMARGGELNIGELTRRRHGESAFSIGFTTYQGTVTAARHWGEPAEQRRVRPALQSSSKICSIVPISALSCSTVTTSPWPSASSVRSASSTGRSMSVRVTTATRSCTSTRRVRWSRWTSRTSGSRANRPSHRSCPQRRCGHERRARQRDRAFGGVCWRSPK